MQQLWNIFYLYLSVFRRWRCSPCVKKSTNCGRESGRGPHVTLRHTGCVRAPPELPGTSCILSASVWGKNCAQPHCQLLSEVNTHNLTVSLRLRKEPSTCTLSASVWGKNNAQPHHQSLSYVRTNHIFTVSLWVRIMNILSVSVIRTINILSASAWGWPIHRFTVTH